MELQLGHAACVAHDISEHCTAVVGCIAAKTTEDERKSSRNLPSGPSLIDTTIAQEPTIGPRVCPLLYRICENLVPKGLLHARQLERHITIKTSWSQQPHPHCESREKVTTLGAVLRTCFRLEHLSMTATMEGFPEQARHSPETAPNSREMIQ